MGLNHAIDRLPVRQRVDFANIVQRNRQECPAGIYAEGISHSHQKHKPTFMVGFSVIMLIGQVCLGIAGGFYNIDKFITCVFKAWW